MAYPEEFQQTSEHPRINVHDHDDIMWWMEQLGVSYEQIRQAVVNVGSDAARVASYLNSSLPLDFILRPKA